MAVGSKDGHAMRLSAIVDDARSVWQYLVRGDELPCADKRVRGWRLGMRGGNGECHGSNEGNDASDHGYTVPTAGTLHNLIVFTRGLSGAYAFRNTWERCGSVSSARAPRVAAPSKEWNVSRAELAASGPRCSATGRLGRVGRRCSDLFATR